MNYEKMKMRMAEADRRAAGMYRRANDRGMQPLPSEDHPALVAVILACQRSQQPCANEPAQSGDTE